MLNGGSIGYFGVERGLRQGDPISPMLFIIAKEVLCRRLTDLVAKKRLKALNGPRGATTPMHSVFADDIFIFSNALIRLKEEGGLGLRRLRDMNKATLCSLAWRIKHEKSFAYNFLRARFLKRNGSLRPGYRASSIWPGIREVWGLIVANERWMVGNGRKIDFWKDKWVNGFSVQDSVEDTGDQGPLMIDRFITSF
ncbi:uncharacterized protein LOC122093869 [Macadamia integrifolia]|uniref:uncharacterized protein LOC122093869 n=1 Tax=Macadamia integrifolia TaxID=60698 RepID=UPI001C52B346|nr:uncharacterized protein LOC122093869 [Macadamia integrifolia]